MTKQKPDSAREQAERRLREEALDVARSIQTPGQTKEQTRLVAKGIEKGIALYKHQQKLKSRERDKARKKALRQALPESGHAGQEAPSQDHGRVVHAHALNALLVSGVFFSLAALAQGLRFLLGWRIVLGDHEIPSSWSLAAACVLAGLAFWMFRAALDLTKGKG